MTEHIHEACATGRGLACKGAQRHAPRHWQGMGRASPRNCALSRGAEARPVRSTGRAPPPRSETGAQQRRGSLRAGGLGPGPAGRQLGVGKSTLPWPASAGQQLFNQDVRLAGRQALAAGERVGDQHGAGGLPGAHPYAPVLAHRQLERQRTAQRRQHLARAPARSTASGGMQSGRPGDRAGAEPAQSQLGKVRTSDMRQHHTGIRATALAAQHELKMCTACVAGSRAPRRTPRADPAPAAVGWRAAAAPARCCRSPPRPPAAARTLLPACVWRGIQHCTRRLDTDFAAGEWGAVQPCSSWSTAQDACGRR